MDRRSWPWKKKSSKHSGAAAVSVAASANASPVNRSSRRHDDHGMSKFLADQVQEATLRSQESEEKLRGVNAQLAAAQAEISEKEALVKQHAKVAEEAVTGWERAEEEAASVKLQLDTTTAKLEAKISQLDASLKESLRSAQKAKEEHERKMQDLTARKNKECERVRADLESRLSDVGHRLLESTAESKVLASTLQERMRAMAEVSDSRSKAEAEIGVLSVRLESMEKDNLSLEYEIQVLNKQLQIRNEEKEYCKREADAASKQQLEGFKKIQQLEGECQRLKTLLKRKLPGPAAVAQMKQEVDAWGREERRRSFGSARGGDQGRLSGGNKDFQVQLLTERVLSMEEETKMLREVLAQKNNELQAARSMTSAAHSASSSIRGGLKPRALSLAASDHSSVNNEDGVSAADAWVSELEVFKKDQMIKGASGGGGSPGILTSDSKYQMMDDFAEMEQLTSVQKNDPPAAAAAAAAAKDEQRGTSKAEEQVQAGDEEEQLQAANRLCMEISSKLVATEKEFAALQAKNAINEDSLIKLQEKLDLLQERSVNSSGDFDKVDESQKMIQAALNANVSKVICLVEALANAIGVDHCDDNHSLPSPSTTTSAGSSCSSSDQSGNSLGINERLTAASSKIADLQGSNSDRVSSCGFTDFLAELCAVLQFMSMSFSSGDHHSSGSNGSLPELAKLQKENGKLLGEVKKVCDEVNRLKVEKELLHESCERSNQRLQEVQSQLAAAERLVAELKIHVGEGSKYILELEERIKAADATVGDLREKLVAAEAGYQTERDQHQALVCRYEEVQKQISIKTSSATAGQDHQLNNDEQGEEIAVKLAECQRTILALGKQLKVLSEPEKALQGYDEISYSDERTEEKSLSLSSNNNNNHNKNYNDDGEFSWSRIKLQGFEPEALACWSPPRSGEAAEEHQLCDSGAVPRYGRTSAAAAVTEEADSTWLYSPDHRRTVMRSPGRFLSKKNNNSNSNELSKSVNLPVTPKGHHGGGSSFSRFFSRKN